VLAVPVAPAETIRRLRPEADDVVALIAPAHFFGGAVVRRLPPGRRRARRRAAGRRRSRVSVSVPELVIAGVCGAAGVRSLVVALRRPFEPVDTRDRLLYALHLT